MQEAAKCPTSSQDFEQDQSRGHWRHDQWKRNQGLDQRFTPPVVSRQEPCDPKAEWQDDDSAKSRDPRGEPNDLPFFTAHAERLFADNEAKFLKNFGRGIGIEILQKLLRRIRLFRLFDQRHWIADVGSLGAGYFICNFDLLGNR